MIDVSHALSNADCTHPAHSYPNWFATGTDYACLTPITVRTQTMNKEIIVGARVVYRDYALPTQSVATNSPKVHSHALLQNKDKNHNPGVHKKVTQINSPQCVWNLRFHRLCPFPTHHTESSIGSKRYIGL